VPGGKAGQAGPGRRRKPLYLLHSGERRKCNEIGSWGSWTLLESSALILKEKFEQRSVLAKYMACPSWDFLAVLAANSWNPASDHAVERPKSADNVSSPRISPGNRATYDLARRPCWTQCWTFFLTEALPQLPLFIVHRICDATMGQSTWLAPTWC